MKRQWKLINSRISWKTQTLALMLLAQGCGVSSPQSDTLQNGPATTSSIKDDFGKDADFLLGTWKGKRLAAPWLSCSVTISKKEPWQGAGYVALSIQFSAESGGTRPVGWSIFMGAESFKKSNSNGSGVFATGPTRRPTEIGFASISYPVDEYTLTAERGALVKASGKHGSVDFLAVNNVEEINCVHLQKSASDQPTL